MAQHARILARMSALAAAQVERGTLEGAAVRVQAAAHYAWRNHPGRFADADLEETVGRIARRLFGRPPPVEQASPEPRSTLHVLTQALDLGGHTRLCWRWMQADDERRHSVAVTHQDAERVPDPVTAAVTSTGGRVFDLYEHASGVLERATALRRLAGEHEAVVLHVDPHDVVSAVAFALPGPAPVLFMNHAEQVFWLGAQSADYFVHIRESAAEHAAQRRGIPLELSAIVPIPVEPARGSAGSRERTRRELGVRDGETMLLTVANSYKFLGTGTDFLAIVLPALSDLPAAKLVAVGPSDEGPWAEARVATGGRVLPLGFRRDVPDLLQAADVYIDSFPMGSVTSLLEAGMSGLPLLRIAGGLDGVPVFEPHLPTLEPYLIEASGRLAFKDALAGLVQDPARRAELGARTRDNLEAHHAGDGWLATLMRAYAGAAAAASARAPRAVVPRAEANRLDPVDLGLSRLNAYSDSQVAFLLLLPRHCRLLPRAAAARMWLEFVVAMREDLWDPPRMRLAFARAWKRGREGSAVPRATRRGSA